MIGSALFIYKPLYVIGHDAFEKYKLHIEGVGLSLERIVEVLLEIQLSAIKFYDVKHHTRVPFYPLFCREHFQADVYEFSAKKFMVTKKSRYLYIW